MPARRLLVLRAKWMFFVMGWYNCGAQSADIVLTRVAELEKRRLHFIYNSFLYVLYIW